MRITATSALIAFWDPVVLVMRTPLPEEQDQGLERERVGPALLGVEQPQVVPWCPAGRLPALPDEPDHAHLEDDRQPPRQVDREPQAEQGQPPQDEAVQHHPEGSRVDRPGPATVAGRRGGKVSRSPWASTTTVSPSPSSPASRRLASSSPIALATSRRSGRAP